VLICCDHIDNNVVNTGHPNGKMYTNDYLQARARVQNNRYKDDYAAVGTPSCIANVSVAPEFLCLLWVVTDKQTRNYYALISAVEEIDSEAFSWSRAHTFSFNKNSIGKAIVMVMTCATATHLHLSVHSTAPLLRCQPGQIISSAECIMHCAAHASHRTGLSPPLAFHPLVPLSTWTLVHQALRHLFMLIVQVPLESYVWLMMVHTLK